MDQLRREKKLTATMAEVVEKLRSRKAKPSTSSRPARILTQFRSLSGQIRWLPRALLKSTRKRW